MTFLNVLIVVITMENSNQDANLRDGGFFNYLLSSKVAIFMYELMKYPSNNHFSAKVIVLHLASLFN